MKVRRQCIHQLLWPFQVKRCFQLVESPVNLHYSYFLDNPCSLWPIFFRVNILESCFFALLFPYKVNSQSLSPHYRAQRLSTTKHVSQFTQTALNGGSLFPMTEFAGRWVTFLSCLLFIFSVHTHIHIHSKIYKFLLTNATYRCRK